jgi:lysyl-tRNA synthetase class 1
MNPPEVLKYMFLRVNPYKSIDYDFKDGMPIIADEFDRIERLYFSDEQTEEDENLMSAYRISRNNVIPEKLPVQVPYGHLVNLVQMADDFEGVLKILERTGYLEGATEADIAAIKRRADSAKYWLDGGYADEKYRFSVAKEMPAVELSADEKAFLADLAAKLEAAEWGSDAISTAISEAGSASPIGNKNAFKVMYKILIQKERGPRLANFLASMDKDFVVGRVKEASC